MNKLITTIVLCGLAIILFLGIFQSDMGGNMKEKGVSVNNNFRSTADTIDSIGN